MEFGCKRWGIVLVLIELIGRLLHDFFNVHLPFHNACHCNHTNAQLCIGIVRWIGISPKSLPWEHSLPYCAQFQKQFKAWKMVQWLRAGIQRIWVWFQHPHGGCNLEHPMSSFGLCGHCSQVIHRHAFRQNTHTHKVKINKSQKTNQTNKM